MAAETQSIRAASQAAPWVGELRVLGDAQVIGSLKNKRTLANSCWATLFPPAEKQAFPQAETRVLLWPRP
jgi:hypothetical protein